MKKILLTLFAVAAVFVACDKDALDNDATSINVLEAAEEINASVELSHDDAFEFLNSIVESGDFETPTLPKGDASTAKAGDFGDNWIQVMYFDYTFLAALGERDYALVVSDDNDVACPSAEMLNVQEVSYSLAPRVVNGVESPVLSNLIIETISATGTVSSSRAVSSAGWRNAFASNFDRVYPATADRTSIAGGPAPTRSTFDTTCNEDVDYSQYYSVEPAPFPLTGFLARITGDITGMGDGASLNYAASDERELRTAIERDILNDNAHVSTTALTQ